MNKNLILVPAALLAFLNGFCQNSGTEQYPVKRLPETSEPIGHYLTLQKLSADPIKGQEQVEAIRFPKPGAASLQNLETIKLVYLAGKKRGDFRMPEPPANSSVQTRAELDFMLQLQTRRTEEDVRRSKYLAGVFFSARTKPGDADYKSYVSNLFQIGHSIGNWFNPDSLPKTTLLVSQVMKESSYFNWTLKYHYLRPLVALSQWPRHYGLCPRLSLF
jgi:acid phosphatase (class A)